MKSKIFFTTILVLGLTFVSFETFGQTGKNAAMTEQTTKYSCPHHPDVVSDKPGKCACGTELVAMTKHSDMSGSDSMEKKKTGDDSKAMKHDDMMKNQMGTENDKMKMKNDTVMMKKEKM